MAAEAIDGLVHTVRAMLSEIERGFPPAQAARLELAGARTPDAAAAVGTAAESGRFAAARAQLIAALTAFEDRRALDTVLDDVMQPGVREIGDGWERGEVTVAQEHFASNLIRERLLGLDRPWDQCSGPGAVLACPADERHNIGLVSFGIVLRRGGWPITLLLAGAPVAAAHRLAAAGVAGLRRPDPSRPGKKIQRVTKGRTQP